jgi:hypothetical protein
MSSLKGVSRFSLDTSTLQFFKLDHLLFEIYSNCIFYFKKYLFKLEKSSFFQKEKGCIRFINQ